MARSNVYQTPRRRRKSRPESLGMKGHEIVALAQAVQRGLSFSALVRFHRRSGFSLPFLAKAMHIPARTLARRKASGRLTSVESERLLRLANVFNGAVDLFENDVAAARDWLQAPNKALGGLAPLSLAETEVGARAVEELIGRLEHGVFS